jgi:hypothetical protein
VDGLAGQAEIARDRRERRAVGESVRHLAALERLELVPQLAQAAQRGTRRGRIRRLRCELREPLTWLRRLPHDVIRNPRPAPKSGSDAARQRQLTRSRLVWRRRSAA